LIELSELTVVKSIGFSVDETKKKTNVMKFMEPYFLLSPSLLALIVFLYYPFLKTIALSLSITNSQGVAKAFVGLRNYFRIFSEDGFWETLLRTFYFSGIVIMLSMILGFLTSVLANVKGKAFAPFGIVFSMPLAAASSGVAIVFQKMFDPASGVINKIFGTDFQWFLDPAMALPLTAVVTVWMMSGTNFIFMNAGMKNIPAELYESAEIDGAGFWRKLAHITLPGISPVMFFVLTLNVVSAFQAFAQVNIITQGGPGDATRILVFSIYRDAFFNFRFDFAAAQSVVLFLIILAITLVQFKNEKRMVHYS